MDSRKSPDTNKPSFAQFIGRLFLWLIAMSLIFYYFYRPYESKDIKEISYTEFKDYINQEKISEVTVTGNEIQGSFKEPIEVPTGKDEESKKTLSYKYFKTVMPSFGDPSLLSVLEKKGVTVKAEVEKRSWFTLLLINLLPWVLILGFFIYTSKKFQERMGGGGGLFSFGKSKAKLYTKSTSEITFDDVAGMKNAKKELIEVIEFLKNPEKFRSLGGTLPKGILLIGPPGNGKTLLARATAGEAGVPFYSLSGSEFIEMFVGVGASRVRDMFKKAKKDAPSIIFIDEIDSIGRVRGTGVGGGHDEREQTLNQILSEMDGFSPQESVVVMAATNRPDVLDPALVRPGRFDRRITLELPKKDTRKQILLLHTKNMPLADNVDMDIIASSTVAFSGADLKNLANEAALLAARKGKNHIHAEDLDQARDKITMGIKREDIINDEEKKIIAFHEAGHTLVAKFLPGADPLNKVTIIPRGRALGATEQIPEEDRYNVSRTYLLTRIAVLLGGRVSEKLKFNNITSGASNDLKKATQLARNMVCQFGMSDKIGPVVFKHGEQHPFLGREMTSSKDFSEHTAKLIDEEVRNLILEREKKAEEILTSHREDLETLAQALIEHESLDKEEIDCLLNFDKSEKKDSEADLQKQTK
jgi:cell division protease FtsH